MDTQKLNFHMLRTLLEPESLLDQTPCTEGEFEIIYLRNRNINAHIWTTLETHFADRLDEVPDYTWEAAYELYTCHLYDQYLATFNLPIQEA